MLNGIFTDYFRLQRETDWPEVKRVWQNREEEIWRPHYTARGFTSWWDWRATYMQAIGLGPEHRQWRLFSISEPERVIPSLLVGSYEGWRRYYPAGQQVATFADLAQSPLLGDNKAIQELLRFPPRTRRIIGLRLGERVVIRDGTHHCAALALRVRRGEYLTHTHTSIALTTLSSDEAGIFERATDQRFAIGSSSAS